MSLHTLQYVIDAQGRYLKTPLNRLTSFDDNATSIQVITPFLGAVSLGIETYDSSALKAVQHMPNQNLKGKDVLDENDPLYQEVYDWNVYSIPVRQKSLMKISRHHSGRIGISFTFRLQQEASNYAENFKGYIGRTNPPASATPGDYYVVDIWNYNFGTRVLTKGDIVFYKDNNWLVDKAFRIVKNTETVDIPVDPTVYAYEDE